MASRLIFFLGLVAFQLAAAHPQTSSSFSSSPTSSSSSSSSLSAWSSSSSSPGSSSSSSANGGVGLMSEQQLYGTLGSIDNYAQGYGGNSDKTERIDQPVQQLPPLEETQEGKEQIIEHRFPDEHREGTVNLNKEIHSYTVQKKILNVKNRIVHRYLKNLLVTTLYNTNVRRIQHQKLVNLLVNTLQEVHQPKLFIKYSRNDNVQNVADVNEKPEVTEEKQDKVLPPVFLPAQAEKVGYDGQSLSKANNSK